MKQLSPSLKIFAKNKAHQWASKQTWNQRAYVWKELFRKLMDGELDIDEAGKHTYNRLREEQQKANKL